MELQAAKLFYGLHAYPGVASYQNSENPFTILLDSDTLKTLDPSFQGKQVCIDHPVNGERLVAGYVVRSFFNPADGKHWAEFMITDDEALNLIEAGWLLSNCITVLDREELGTNYIGVYCDYKLLDGEYDHLAIVSTPRYNESMILTPEQFKEYNDIKKGELTALSNKEDPITKGDPMKLKIFKKAKSDVKDLNLSETFVTLPKLKREVSLEQLINEADDVPERRVADGDDIVRIGDEELSVSEIVARIKSLVAELSELKAKLEGDEEEIEEELENEDEGEELENENEEEEEPKKDDKDGKKLKNSVFDVPARKQDKKGEARAQKLKNSIDAKVTGKAEGRVLSVGADRLKLGKELF